MNGDYVTPSGGGNAWKGICWNDWKKSNGKFVLIEKVILMVKPTEN